MIHSEYSRFLKTIVSEPPEVRKLANIIKENLDEIIPLGSSQGSRIKKIAELAQKNWDSSSHEIEPSDLSSITSQHEFFRIKSLEVGPFRGFSRKESFDLNQDIILIYGPNGTGKSSFCESLEYGLLGTVIEAGSKRFSDVNYLKNAHVGNFELPIIKGITKCGNEIDITSNESLYRFCFLEKNRIDNFSRIAAHIPSKQSELISILFGLDSFNNFVKNFSPSMDHRYIDLQGGEAIILIAKQQSVETSRKLIEQKEATLLKFREEAQQLAENYRSGINFEQLQLELYGNESQQGLITLIQEELSAPIPLKNNLKSVDLETIFTNINEQIKIIDEQKINLNSNSRNVSFQNLYSTILSLKDESEEQCPACKTSLEVVAVNPYSLAESEIGNLKNLADIQEKINKAELVLKDNLMALVNIVNKCNEFLVDNPLINLKILQITNVDLVWWQQICTPFNDGKYPWQHIREQVAQLEKQDQEINNLNEIRNQKKQTQILLNDYHQKITALKAKYSVYQTDLNNAYKVIEDFNLENIELIRKVEKEKLVVEKNKIISESYCRLVEILNVYKDGLVGELTSDLGGIIVEIYNSLNRCDKPSELLAEIRLPLIQNEKIEVSFQNSPNKFFDALHVLSEGHIRCIGLSMLLAKNIKENCPFLIFDDPVNAIDDEHRENIRLTLFVEKLFKDKQIIIACHGEEFFKDIQNLLPSNPKKYKSFTFLPKIEDYHLNIDFNCTPRNYLENARIKFNKNEVRYCLASCRQALEVLATKKIWRYVDKYGDSQLNLIHYSYNSPLILRNVLEQLRSKINHSSFSDQNKANILQSIDIVLGIGASTREWTYLNKGVHEESDGSEFNRAVVESILTSLENIEVHLS